MRNYFKLELKKTLFSLKTLIFILIIILFISVPYLREIGYIHPNFDGIDYFLNFYKISYVVYIIPLTSLIYCTTIIKEKENGIMIKLFEVMGIKDYFIVKAIINFLINFLVVAISEVIILLYFIFKYGLNNRFLNINPILNISSNYKFIYVSFMIILIAISAASFATLVLGVVTAFKKKSLSVIFPVFYIIITGVFFGDLSLNNVISFNILKLFSLLEINNNFFINSMVYDICLILLGLLLLYFFFIKEITKKNIFKYKDLIKSL
ncbi:hypothetical protein [Clostridium fallax]|uniref:ABC-2 family transporter protein n=1 Tax=Clostridium fallax TaxID=1533 RepID=A0A1M4XZY4_9CLOT|nr:hypothetical protein [Clostridium fallax]SHE98873.1 hypothetical protein SAMN05443638_12230 [Clostridium fallax]SQB06497.1 Uncharacterised protein [Clostridium fallax]